MIITISEEKSFLTRPNVQRAGWKCINNRQLNIDDHRKRTIILLKKEICAILPQNILCHICSEPFTAHMVPILNLRFYSNLGLRFIS